jgi:Fe-S-cluster-containing dehydrogenase component
MRPSCPKPPAHQSRKQLPGNTTGPRQRRQPWRSLDPCETACGERDLDSAPPETTAFQLPPLNRRAFLRLTGGGLALAGLAACARPPQETIVPYVKAPEYQVSGESLFYATALPLDGYARGVLVETAMGRPIKIEGNPEHPASLGATDVYAQAAMLELWDPDRSAALLHNGQPASWPEATAALQDAGERHAASEGRGLAILTGSVTSPSFAAQLQAVLERWPRAHWYHEPDAGEAHALSAAEAAFGERLLPRLHLDRAEVILTLDADPLGPGPEQVRHAHDFATARDAGSQSGSYARLYAVEPSPTLTGAAADHRLPLRASRVEAAARALARRLGLDLPAARDNPLPESWLNTLAEDLRGHPGRALVVAGPRQPVAVHRIVCAINDRLGALGNTLNYAEPAAATATPHAGGLAALAAGLRAGNIDTLLLLDVNPVYSAPADLAFSDALGHAHTLFHLGLYRDETAQQCHWHIPAAHPLESWSDLRAADGTVSLAQPTIAPLHGGRSAGELLQSLGVTTPDEPYQQLRAHWRDTLPGENFENGWHQALRLGLIAGTALPASIPTLREDWDQGLESDTAAPAAGLELQFTLDPAVYDGRFANNGWLQELPRPLSKLTWGNAALIAPATASRLGLQDGDVVRLTLGQRSLEAPVWRLPGQAEDSITLPLGYGRRHAGNTGNGVGFDANRLRSSATPWLATGATLEATGGRVTLACTQTHQAMAGENPVHCTTLSAHRAASGSPPYGPSPSLYPERPPGEHAWGMSIDLNACIGCGACTIACQAENNIPVVGREEVMQGREMHWLRVDRYFDGPPAAPDILFQPVPCMHCEQAPCEVVCPVGATLHDNEGLNLQVYNRCVGTRFCSNNCPYKVRRFNFLQYAGQDETLLAARRNPQVSVRQRGVMEKCSYCLQRINAGRRQAQKEERALRDGDVVTACQGVCPTRAIVFGDLKDTGSHVVQAKASRRDYVLLRELNTRPRTSYQERVVNPHPKLQQEDEAT